MQKIAYKKDLLDKILGMGHDPFDYPSPLKSTTDSRIIWFDLNFNLTT